MSSVVSEDRVVMEEREMAFARSDGRERGGDVDRERESDLALDRISIKSNRAAVAAFSRFDNVTIPGWIAAESSTNRRRRAAEPFSLPPTCQGRR